MSPFLESLVDGSFEELERQAGVVPFSIGEQEFDKLYVLVDGIYTRWSRFIRGFKDPVTKPEKNFTEWQEAKRKDIERAFGIFQSKTQWAARPIHLHDLNDIALRVGTCCIFHNMCVAERVMEGDVRATYNPLATLDEVTYKLTAPEEQQEVQQRTNDGVTEEDADNIGIRNLPSYAHDLE